MTIYGVARSVVLSGLAVGIVWLAIDIDWDALPRTVLVLFLLLIALVLVGFVMPDEIGTSRKKERQN